ncbi:MAG: restriction endonuclease subunit S, partial [Oscillospiraceae bacterium]|nr:restriction endonuclease subunit S [Oscillospiraceae bacterium]
MSRLDELIAELCPDGVEFKTIKEEYTRLKGTPITAGKMKEIDNPDGEIRVFAGGKTVINAREEDIPNANITRVPAVLVQSRGVIDFVFYEEPFTFKNEMWAYTHKERISVKFLYYVLKNNAQHFRDAASGMGSLPQISLPVTEEFKVPVPPLEVQREIVRVLDNFTFLSAELSAELSARRKQYEYYRNQMLTFDNESKRMHLSDVADLFRGEYITQKGSKPGNIPVILGGQEPAYYIDKANHEGERVVIARSGVSAGFVSYWNQPIYVTDGFGYEAKKGIVTPKYLYYALKRKEPELNAMKRGAGVPHVSGEMLGKVELSIPTIAVQERLIKVLDNFETICSDLSIGLPAEIEARQKQYEYYRDLLLTFAETDGTLTTDRQT